MSGFKITDGRGFHITFENGWTVSVQFAAGNYCDNYRNPINAQPRKTECANAEIAAWDPKGEWLQIKENDTVSGYMCPNMVLEFMSFVAGLPT